jgi:hypothetical protein
MGAHLSSSHQANTSGLVAHSLPPLMSYLTDYVAERDFEGGDDEKGEAASPEGEEKPRQKTPESTVAPEIQVGDSARSHEHLDLVILGPNKAYF